MIAINIIIDTPMRINMLRSWETPRQAENRRQWKCHAIHLLNDRLPIANDTVDQRTLRHIAGLEQSGKFYEYNTINDYLEA